MHPGSDYQYRSGELGGGGGGGGGVDTTRRN